MRRSFSSRTLLVASMVSLGGTVALTWGACGRERPHVLDGDDDGPNGGRGAGGSSSNGFVTDGAAICGNDVHQPVTHPPLIYFVIDRSGSMVELSDNGDTRLERVVDAAVTMVDDLGALVRAGAALFPSPEANDNEECLAGEEVFAPKVGALVGNFANAIDEPPLGGTPIAATLEALTPRISEFDEPRAVILATDGGPNCNESTTCDEDECMVNIFGECPADVGNCCDPLNGGTWLNCVDRQATILAVQALANSGTDVYVVGIPGSEQFAAILNQMAFVGGVPREDSDDQYYRVDDLGTLTGLFKEIAASLVSCTFDLSDPPEAPGKTNVYFDGVVVVQDPENGWIWVDADTIELVGDACAELKTGNVKDVQIVSGCPTATPT